MARLIQYLDATQPAGVGYIIENVPGTDKHPEIQAMLGSPLHLDAPPCGSGARRETLFWQNLASNDETLQAYHSLPAPST